MKAATHHCKPPSGTVDGRAVSAKITPEMVRAVMLVFYEHEVRMEMNLYLDEDLARRVLEAAFSAIDDQS